LLSETASEWQGLEVDPLGREGRQGPGGSTNEGKVWGAKASPCPTITKYHQFCRLHIQDKGASSVGFWWGALFLVTWGRLSLTVSSYGREGT
jgi:hypothetical protein